MKRLFLFFLLLVSTSRALAQEGNFLPYLLENAPSRTEWFWGVSYLRWNETLRLQKNTLVDSDVANFTGLNLNLERQVVYANWGWGAGINLGSGRANGGGNSTLVTYQRNNQTWSSFGAVAKAFQRLSPRISLGVAVPLLWRSVNWLSPDGVTEATSGQNMNLGLLFDMVFRLDKRMDLYQEVGALNAQGSTLWRLGVNIRF